MSNRTAEERINALEEKQKQIQAQIRKIKSQETEKARKLRTRRLINLGGIIYSVLGREYADGDEERLKMFLEMQDKRGNYFSSAMNKDIGNNK